jgi:hypothetical protein
MSDHTPEAVAALIVGLHGLRERLMAGRRSRSRTTFDTDVLLVAQAADALSRLTAGEPVRRISHYTEAGEPVFTTAAAAAPVGEALGRFSHHPDPAIDFCIEVEEIAAIAWDRKHGIANPDDASLSDRIFRAMQFRVGGDEGALRAKAQLREVEASPAPQAPAVAWTDTAVAEIEARLKEFMGATLAFVDLLPDVILETHAAAFNRIADAAEKLSDDELAALRPAEPLTAESVRYEVGDDATREFAPHEAGTATAGPWEALNALVRAADKAADWINETRRKAQAEGTSVDTLAGTVAPKDRGKAEVAALRKGVRLAKAALSSTPEAE